MTEHPEATDTSGDEPDEPREATGKTGPQDEPEPAEADRAGRAAGGAVGRSPRELVELWGRRLVSLAVHLLRYRYLTAALFLLAALSLYGAAALSRPSGEPAAAGTRTPVTKAVLACPASGDGGISVLTPPGPGGGGRAEVSSTKDGAAVASITRAGAPWSQDLEKGPDAYAIRGQGALAAGLQAEWTAYDGKGDDRGLAATRCTEPGTDLWFVGPGPLDAERLDLYLTNVDSRPATVDLTALSGEGPLDTVDGRGTPVGPNSTRIVRIGDGPEGLGEIVNTAQVMALRVRATTGRVAAAVRARMGDGKGEDWLPVAGAPATSLTVPGVPGGPGGRRLLVAVPGQDDAHVRVQVLTATGSFAPEGQDTLVAPAGTVTPLALERALSGKAAAVRLVSDRPIVAGFTAERGDDVGYGAAASPLAEAGGVVADNRFGTSVLLTAPDRAATVRVTTVDGQGRAGGPQQVRIAAGRTVEVRPAAPAGAGSGEDSDAGFGVVIVPLPGSGPVHAARVMETGRDDRLFTVLPVVPAVTTLLLPPVVDTQGALIP